MRIYIDNYSPKRLIINNQMQNCLRQLDANNFIHQHKTTNIYSDEGIFSIDHVNNKIYKMHICNDSSNLKTFKAGPNTTLLLDYSFYKNEEWNQLPVNHVCIQETVFKYTINKKGSVALIVKGKYENQELSKNAELRDKYLNFIPNDFYFEINDSRFKKEEDIFSPSIKEELNVFLSVLN